MSKIKCKFFISRTHIQNTCHFALKASKWREEQTRKRYKQRKTIYKKLADLRNKTKGRNQKAKKTSKQNITKNTELNRTEQDLLDGVWRSGMHDNVQVWNHRLF